jgi:tRNA(Ile)-lysidine synthase
MLALGDSDRASAQVDLPDGYRARKEYHHIVLLAPACATERNLVEEESQLGDSLDLARDPDDNAGLVQRSLLQVRVMSIADYMALSTDSNGTCYAAFDYDVLTAKCGGAPERMIIWRTRRPGDVLPIRGGRKKLQDVFVDDKVPRFRREEIWLAAIGSEVLWIPVQEGFVQRARYAAGYGVIAETKKVLVLERSVDL